MSALHAFVLAFALCAPHAQPFLDAENCVEGEVRARSCEAAEAWVRGGMRAGQVLHVIHCGEA